EGQRHSLVNDRIPVAVVVARLVLVVRIENTSSPTKCRRIASRVIAERVGVAAVAGGLLLEELILCVVLVARLPPVSRLGGQTGGQGGTVACAVVNDAAEAG